MFKQGQKRKIILSEIQIQPQSRNRLSSILKIFKHNHQKLMRKIEETDKKRELLH
jgi:hypothetical protein